MVPGKKVRQMPDKGCSVEGCSKKHYARGYCLPHHSRVKKHGDPGRAEIRNRKTGADLDALRDAGIAATGSGCVLAPNGRRPLATGRGYRPALARVVWEAVNGPVPDGLLVLHWCHNDACVSALHLYLGTVAENSADRSAVYEIGRAIVAARVQAGGPGIARGNECERP